MKSSACTAAFGMVDLKKTIGTSAKLGYDVMELTATLHLSMESTPERRKEILGWIHDAGIVCSALYYIFDGAIRLLSTDLEMMNQPATYLKQVVGVTYDIEYPTVIAGSGGKTRSFEPDWDREAGVKCMAEVIRRVGPYAQEKGVILTVEAINQYETNFLDTLEEVVNFVNMVNPPNMRTIADIYHLNIEEVNPAETIRKYGHALANLHLTGSNRQAPGDGHFDFASVMETPWKVDFRGYCSFEVFRFYLWKFWYDTPEESVEHVGNGIKHTRSIFEWIMLQSGTGTYIRRYGKDRYYKKNGIG